MDPLDYMIAGLGSWLILSVVSATAWSFVATRCKRRAREYTNLAAGLPPVPPVTEDGRGAAA